MKRKVEDWTRPEQNSLRLLPFGPGRVGDLSARASLPALLVAFCCWVFQILVRYTFFMTSARPSPPHQRWLPVVLAAGLLVSLWQILKGLSLKPALYPLMTNLFTYADGPVRRGFFPTLMAPFQNGNFDQLMMSMTVRHLLFLAVLLGYALYFLTRLWQSGSEHNARLAVFMLFLASPVLPLLAALNGYADSAIVLGLIALQALLIRQKTAAAGLLLTALVLVHEMVLPLAIPLWLAAAVWAPSRTDRKKLLLVLGSCLVVITAYLAWTAHFQNQFYPVAAARCETQIPLDHPHYQTAEGQEIWSTYCSRQMRATLASDFVPLRLIVLPFFWLAYGLFPLVLLLLWFGQTSRTTLRTGLALLLLLAMPYALVMIAWDIDRFIMLACVTGWLLLDRWLSLHPAPNPSRALWVSCAALTAFQLAMSYPAIDVYGQARVISPQLERAYLIDPRSWTLPVIEKAGLFTPPFLDPKTCIDPRC